MQGLKRTELLTQRRLRQLAMAVPLCMGVYLISGCSARETSTSASVHRSIAGSTGTQGWYSEDQARAGAEVFKEKCAVCHGDKLQGGAGPALAGNQFFLRYRGSR